MIEPDIAKKLLDELARLRQSIEADAAQILARTRQERDLAMDAAHMGQWRWDIASNTFTWNDVAKRIFGLPEDAESVDLEKVLHPDDHDVVRSHKERTRQTGTFADVAFRIVRTDGLTRWILTKGKVVPGLDGNPAEWLGGMVDITSRREIEANQSRMRKLEALGQLAGGVAHDFNNLLGAIMGNIDMARRVPEDERDTILDEAIEACVRAADLTRQLLAFGRRKATPDAVVNINDVLTDTLRMLRRII
ncbi:MAG: PAS domain-containing protein, partial [Deltaproteobacteria bacterium]|nr:PAS domain-containing protein [Deltaproteobacteria bacterium]